LQFRLEGLKVRECERCVDVMDTSVEYTHAACSTFTPGALVFGHEIAKFPMSHANASAKQPVLARTQFAARNPVNTRVYMSYFAVVASHVQAA